MPERVPEQPAGDAAVPDGSRDVLGGNAAVVWLALAFLVAGAVFSLWPRIDIAVSRLFYDPAAGFWIDALPTAVWLRWAIWTLSEAMIALAALGLAAAFAGRSLFGIGARIWGFVMALYLAAPGLLVNGLLKSHWGRARPADILEFGGSLSFTPALVPAHECLRNCSFVSGEGAAAVALCLALLALLAALGPRLTKGSRRVGAAVAILLALAGSALRIMAGRHFLSDTVFALLFDLAIALALWRLLGLGRRLSLPGGR